MSATGSSELILTYAEIGVSGQPRGTSIWGRSEVIAIPDCGITDTWTRTVGSAWGTSDSTVAWTQAGQGGTGAASVDGTRGVLVAPLSSYIWERFDRPLSETWAVPRDIRFSLSFANLSPAATTCALRVVTAKTSGGGSELIFNPNISGSDNLYFAGPDGTSTEVDQSVPLRIHVYVTSSQVAANVWAASGSEPGGWMVTQSLTAETGIQMSFYLSQGATSTDFTAYLDDLDITDVNRCTMA